MADSDQPQLTVSQSVQEGQFPLALYNLRRQLGRDYNTCWLLVTLAALFSWSIGPVIAAFLSFVLESLFGSGIINADPSVYGVYAPQGFLYSGGMSALSISGYIGGGIFPVAVVLWALHIFRTVKARTINDLTQGNMALVLIDEQYSFLIEESVQNKYNLVLGKIQLGSNLSNKVNHFAYYYKYYYRMSFGPAEINVPAISAESCWLEGCAIAACNSCPPILITLVVRIILVRPRVLAIKTAVTEYLEGRYDHLLEQDISDSAH